MSFLYFILDQLVDVNLYRPNFYFSDVSKIPFDELKRMGIKYILIDQDNTFKYKGGMLCQRAVNALKKEAKEFGLIVITNYIAGRKRKQNARASIGELGHRIDRHVPGILLSFSRRKPKKWGFMKALDITGAVLPGEFVVIGDQIPSDILGGNQMGMTTILVDPLDPDGYSKMSLLWRVPFQKYLKSRLRLRHSVDEKIAAGHF